MISFREYFVLHLLCSSQTPNPILGELYRKFLRQFPMISMKRSTWYQLISRLDREELIEITSHKGIPPTKRMKITPKGINWMESMRPSLSNCFTSPPQTEESYDSSEPDREISSGELGDLIKTVIDMLPEIMGKEMEDVTRSDAELLLKVGNRIVNILVDFKFFKFCSSQFQNINQNLIYLQIFSILLILV